MICLCGAELPITSRYSICETCMKRGNEDDYPEDYEEYEDYEPDEPSDGMTDVEADADTLRSAGMGTDEDYGYYGENDGY